jgi:restriction system protein
MVPCYNTYSIRRITDYASVGNFFVREIKPINITPEEFEQQVKAWLAKSCDDLKSFTITHRENLEGRSGEYEIDAVARFEIFGGAEIVVLVECKRYKNPIKRDVVMLLNQKLQEIGAHKGMVFSTSGFQSGAINFATEHRIATITVQDGKTNYHTKSYGPDVVPPPWVHISKFIGWFTDIGPNGFEHYSLVDDNNRIEPLAAWFEDREEA